MSEEAKVKTRQLHTFADGSTQSYGCCVYLRTEFEDGEIESQLIMEKNKVCPIKKSLTVPRVELSAAVLGTRISRLVRSELALHLDSVHFWVDSFSTLKYICNTCRRFQTYVPNRISEIQECTNIDDWHFVPTKQNAADLASRPILLMADATKDRKVKMWLDGPDFIRKDASEWPNHSIDRDLETDDPEVRAQCYVTVVEEEVMLYRMLVKAPNMYNMKVRVAWLQKFVRYLKDKKEVISPPNCSDLRRAEMEIVKLVQKEEFAEEIDKLKEAGKSKKERKGTLPKESRLRRLLPFLDEDGVLRVETRLGECDLPYEYRFPAILPRSHHVTQLLVFETHKAMGHQGTKAVMNELRKKFWILGART